MEATQQYSFHCEICGIHAPVPGPGVEPHAITRTFQYREQHRHWRYQVSKHRMTARMDIRAAAYDTDSAGVGVGPEWLAGSVRSCDTNPLSVAGPDFRHDA